MMLFKMNCRSCRLVARVLDNPYQYSGQVVAKLGVNLATVIWAVVVVWKEDALRNWPTASWFFGKTGEDYTASVIFVLSCIATVRLLLHRPPIAWGACIYGAFLMLWLYTWFTLVIAIHLGITALRPGQLAGVTLTTCLALFAFVANPKKRGHGSPVAP